MEDERVVLGAKGAGVVEWSYSLERHRPSVPVPNAEAANKPDSGANALRVHIACVVNRPDMGSTDRATSAAQTLSRWCTLPQVIPGIYDYGNVGLWFWPEEILTHHPKRGAGYKLVSAMANGVPNMPSRELINVDLEWAGKFSLHDGLGAST